MRRKIDAALKAKSACRAYSLAAFVALCLVRQPAPAAALHAHRVWVAMAGRGVGWRAVVVKRENWTATMAL